MRGVLLTTLLAVVMIGTVAAQNMPERGEIRRGNKLFEKEEWQAAADSYTKAITYSPTMFEANYNLANAHYKAEDYAKAEELTKQLSADSTLSTQRRAEVFYNLGNSQFQQQKYEEALESYKSSMRLNHADTTAKYNYAYTKLMLQQQQQDEQENQDENQDQDQDNQDQNQDNQDQNQDNQDQNQDQQDQNQDQQDQDNQDQNQEQQPQESNLSEQQRDQILDAIQAQEDKTQDKLDKESARGVLLPSGKNW